jgi:hypothetical protein
MERVTQKALNVCPQEWRVSMLTSGDKGGKKKLSGTIMKAISEAYERWSKVVTMIRQTLNG